MKFFFFLNSSVYKITRLQVVHTEKELLSNICFHKCVIVSYFNILQATNFGSNIKPLSDLIQECRKAVFLDRA
jgi:hypothetical protein